MHTLAHKTPIIIDRTPINITILETLKIKTTLRKSTAIKTIGIKSIKSTVG